MTFDDCRASRAMFDWALRVRRLHWLTYCALMRSVSEWERRLLGCSGKEAFPSFEAATVIATRMMRREPNTFVRAYHCGLCGKFHVAHRNTKTLRAKQHVRNAKRGREYA
jgi:hypothetical protein